MKSQIKLISYRKLSFVVCLLLSLFMVMEDEDEQPVFYNKIKSKTLELFEPIFSFSTSSIHQVSSFVQEVGNIFTIRKDYQTLKARNNFLENYFYLYKQIEGENQALRKQLNFTDSIATYQYTTAQIIARSNNHYNQEITINAGNDQDIQKWQIVLANNNFIGRVVQVNENTANILLITDYDSRIPVKGVRSRTTFIAGGQATPELTCNYLHDQILEENEVVITAGDNPLIISNLIIGIIVKKDDHFYIKPNINLDQIEFVQILKQSQ
jgi:rod shape-determining protein MreC